MDDTATAPAQHEAGLRLIIFYKGAKCVIWLVAAMLLAVGLHFGLTNALRDELVRMEQRLSYEWAIRASHWLLLHAATQRHIVVTILVLLLDGTVTGVEGWALHHRKQWGEWLVIVTTSSFLPFEVWAIVEGLQHNHGIAHRVAILIINVAIVVYLVQRLRWQRREATHAPVPS